MKKSDTIRGLERGLFVLRTLQAGTAASLHDIHRDTRIPKPSLLRILRTLEQGGVISRRLADGNYRTSTNLIRMGRKGDRYDRIAEAAGPVLDRLCRKISWPSDVLVPAGDHMEIRETSRTHSPFRVHVPLVGQPVGWLLTGVGRAYLAFCSVKERERILQCLRRSKKAEDHLSHSPKRLDKIIAETRQRGYGTRDPTFFGGGYGARSLHDGLAAIAVPITDGTRVFGSMNILWIKTAFTIEAFADRHLGELHCAAQEIASSLQSHVNQQNS
jgi:IclR family transcriptional regulator, mhp operon transcriptional activator